MNESLIHSRNQIIQSAYKYLAKPIFFRFDPEDVHDQMTRIGIWLGRYYFGQKVTEGLFGYENKMLHQEIMGIKFKNPIGLSAGFDKNAELTDIIPNVGFGFTEVGSITGKECLGNAKPRLWRLPKSESLVVYYGLKNNGCEAVAKSLSGKHFTIPVGISVAMTNCKENLDLKNAVSDFAKAFRTMEPMGDYITVNISCPNAAGGQPFVDPQKLNTLFDTLDQIETEKPVFIKFSPDLSDIELNNLLDAAKKHRIHGIVCTNLTKKRNNPQIIDDNVPDKGGISGKVVRDLADKMLSYIHKREGDRFLLISSGGVFTAEDAYRKIRLGASLIQIITGMIFEGPQVISQINQGLVRLLERDGFKTIGEARGVDSFV